jgi:hypothetical protein
LRRAHDDRLRPEHTSRRDAEFASRTKPIRSIPARMAFFAEWLITGRDAPKSICQPEPI